MTAEEMWYIYAAQSGCTETYDAWSFGVEADQLAALVLRNIKTATASAYPLYELENEQLPEPGQYSVILDGDSNAVCIICTSEVSVVPFNEVSEEHAYKEGEGDRSLQYWRTVHRTVFAQWMRDYGLQFREDMLVVCEEFVRVFP